MKIPTPAPLVLAALAWATALPLHAQQRIEVTRDLWISSYVKEVEGNNGGSNKLKLKGIQEFFLIDFDPAPLRGRRVTRAQLHVHLMSPEHPLPRITVSSLAQEWVEGAGTGYAKVSGASSFRWARTGESRWSSEGTDITSVMCGEGGSVWGFGDASPPDDKGWQIIPIEPEVAQARIDGTSHGFVVMDDVGSEYTRDGDKFTYTNFVNRYVSSREDRRDYRPFFTLWLDDAGAARKPAPATNEEQTAVAPAKLPDLPPTAGSPGASPPVACRDEFGEPLRSLRFFAAKGECIGFSVAARPADVRVEIDGIEAKLHAMPKVGGQHDPLVPAGFDPGGAPVNLADADTFIDLHVPKAAAHGGRTGTLRVNGADVPLHFTVWNFTLPDRLSFLPQMNAYGLPGQPREWYRLAHENRTVLNQLPYGWRGNVDDPPPVIRADGTWDWTKYDAEFGPLLDGSAFAGLPRAGVPVEAFYLPLNENWPMQHDAHFKGGYWIEHAFDETYWTEFRAAAAEIARHFEERGWTTPVLEFYLNDKVSFKTGGWRKTFAAWIFDEPVHTQDFWALRRYGQEFWKAVAPFQKPALAFRADISRPQWQRDVLDHVTNVEVVSGVLRDYWPRVMRRAEQCGNLYYMYGSASPAGVSGTANAAWCVESWSLGAEGVVPWNTIGKASAWQQPDDLAVIYPTPNGPVPSLRLKAFRAGQQLVEYLEQYAAASNQPRASVMAAVRAIPGVRATLVKKSEEDAGRSLFGAETHAALATLRVRLGRWLDAKAPAPRESWHDPRPRRPDATKARTITPMHAP
ncbi:MAG: DUF4091 domain-containing protein [Verrucomicrobiaceae bacterium]|nr:DUF4091 domain-containing protein [Verrucomicrobiaceae bacterium]